MGQEKSLLVFTEISSNSEYESEREFSTRSALLLYNSTPPTLLPLFLLPINSLLLYIMSCYNTDPYNIIWQ